MKTQMRFQKILMLVTLVVAALSFVYALSFCGGTIYQYNSLYDQINKVEEVEGAEALFLASQKYNDILIGLSVAFIVIVALNFVMASQSRRNYYVTNYVSIILTAVYAVVFAILLLVFVSNTFSLFAAIDREVAEFEYSLVMDDFKYSVVNFILGYLMAALMIVNAVILVLILVWKIKLMKGEKQLLKGVMYRDASGREEEVV